MKYAEKIKWTPMGSDNSVKTAYTTITPEMAKEILSNNFGDNRNVRESVVNKYAQDMRSGRWEARAAEPITISDTGKLLNGQHRLHAVIKAGVQIESEIRFGVPESCYIYFDCGVNRTVADAIGGKYRNNISAVCRAAIAIGARNSTTKKDFETGYGAVSRYITNASVIEFYNIWSQKYPGTLEEATAFATNTKMKFTKWTPKSITLSVLAMMITDKDLAREFMNITSDEKNTSDSVMSYRNWCLRQNLKNRSTAERAYIEWCAAANVWKMLHGYEDKKFRFRQDTVSELIGFKPKVFDVLGNHKQQEGGDE